MMNITVVSLVGRWCDGWTDGTLHLSGSYSLGRSTDRWEILDGFMGTYVGLTRRKLYGTDPGDEHTLVAMFVAYVRMVSMDTYRLMDDII